MLKCLCGCNTLSNQKTTSGWVTDEYGNNLEARFEIGTCEACGLIRQMGLPFSNEEEYRQFYSQEYPPVAESYSIKDYEKDKVLAQKRFSNYGINPPWRLLDVGSGSGAFVDVCRERDIDAYGCEIGDYHYAKNFEFIYKKRLEEVHFPVDYFNVVTCHDVVEHVLDPRSFVAEMFRTTTQGGRCIIEIPRFFHSLSHHHWKKTEHIWYFNTEQFKNLLSDVGFGSIVITHPTETKTIFTAVKPEQKRLSIILPPGIGDSYWELVKMQAFLKRENLGIPDIYIACRRSGSYNAHDRAFSFIEMIPFVHSSGELANIEGQKHRKLWQEAYNQCGQTVFRDIAGCDYFISHNGYMGKGVALDKTDPDLTCNWDLPMFVSKEQEGFQIDARNKYGKYIVFYFVFQGTYKHWVNEFPISRIIEYINALTAKTGFTPVIVGAKWDLDSRELGHIKRQIHNCVDLVGETSLAQVFGLIKGSELVVGFPSGLSIMSTVFKKKTLIIWNDYYNPGFVWNSCPPGTKNKTYFTENTKYLTVKRLVDFSSQIIEGVVKSSFRKQVKPQLKKGRTLVTVLCVLKSGGDYTVDYVERLRNMVSRNSTVPYEFVCLTDLDIDLSICKSVKLQKSYGGWWSKVEIFRPELVVSSFVIYFDLDTVILKNIDDFLTYEYHMMALRPWNVKNQAAGMAASGMMAWQNDGAFSFIFEQFKYENIKNFSGGDQHYISEILLDNGESVDYFQELFKGIYSYKRNCKRGLPPNARIICFHGKPRPHQLKLKWVKENWI